MWPKADQSLRRVGEKKTSKPSERAAFCMEFIYTQPATLVAADCACSRPYSKEYALSLTLSLLLSKQNRRFALDFAWFLVGR